MSSGSIVGGVLGAVAGFFMGGLAGALKGLQLGMTVGGALDPGKGTNTSGPRTTDLSVQTSTLGAEIPRLYGNVPVCGNVFWLENNKLKEKKTKKEVGGKGGGGSSTVTTYTYFATFALGLCKGPIVGIRRIWIGGTLWYDAGSTDRDTVKTSYKNLKYFTLHTGTETQSADSRMQATLGVANTPAYRGLAYIIFKDLPLEKFGNTLMTTQIKVEVLTSSVSAPKLIYSALTDTTLPYSNYYLLNRQNACDSKGRLTVMWSINSGTDQLLFYKNSALVKKIYLSQHEPDLIITSPDRVSLHKFLCAFFHKEGTGVQGFRYLDKNEQLQIVRISESYISGDSLVNANFTEYDGTWWIRSGQKLFDKRLIPILTGNATLGALVIHDGKPALARHPRPTSTTHTLYYTEFDSDGATTKNISINFTHDIPAARYFIVTNGDGSTLRPFIEGDLMYLVYISDYNKDGYNTSIVYVILNIASGTFVSQGAVGVNADASQTSGTNGPIAYPSVSVANGIISCAWEYATYPKKYYQAELVPDTVALGTGPALSTIVSKECEIAGLATSDIDVTSLATKTVRGYRLSSTTVKAAIEPLQTAYPFDVIQSGYKVKFALRGGSSVVTIPKEDLAARQGE